MVFSFKVRPVAKKSCISRYGLIRGAVAEEDESRVREVYLIGGLVFSEERFIRLRKEFFSSSASFLIRFSVIFIIIVAIVFESVLISVAYFFLKAIRRERVIKCSRFGRVYFKVRHLSVTKSCFY
jgi:hypothetical protein